MNLAREEEPGEERALLLAKMDMATVTFERTTEHVLLNEEISQARDAAVDKSCDTSWYLDTGASNHMTGRREIFTEIDVGTTGAIKLGDGRHRGQRHHRLPVP